MRIMDYNIVSIAGSFCATAAMGQPTTSALPATSVPKVFGDCPPGIIEKHQVCLTELCEGRNGHLSNGCSSVYSTDGSLFCSSRNSIWLTAVISSNGATFQSTRLFTLLPILLLFSCVRLTALHRRDSCTVSGSGAPQPCPNGTASSSFQLVSVVDCPPCPPGFYCPDLGTYNATETCTQGYYCPGGDASPTEYVWSASLVEYID